MYLETSIEELSVQSGIDGCDSMLETIQQLRNTARTDDNESVFMDVRNAVVQLRQELAVEQRALQPDINISDLVSFRS